MSPRIVLVTTHQFLGTPNLRATRQLGNFLLSFGIHIHRGRTGRLLRAIAGPVALLPATDAQALGLVCLPLNLRQIAP